MARLSRRTTIAAVQMPSSFKIPILFHSPRWTLSHLDVTVMQAACSIQLILLLKFNGEGIRDAAICANYTQLKNDGTGGASIAKNVRSTDAPTLQRIENQS